MSTAFNISATLDCTGLLCPLPVYKTSVALKNLGTGEVLEVICTDPGSLEDFPALARQTGNVLISSTENGDTQRFLIRKAAA